MKQLLNTNNWRIKMETTLTVKELKRAMFDNGKFLVFGDVEMTNTQGRKFLFDFVNQYAELRVVETESSYLAVLKQTSGVKK
jgi:hypothetical protein